MLPQFIFAIPASLFPFLSAPFIFIFHFRQPSQCTDAAASASGQLPATGSPPGCAAQLPRSPASPAAGCCFHHCWLPHLSGTVIYLSPFTPYHSIAIQLTVFSFAAINRLRCPLRAPPHFFCHRLHFIRHFIRPLSPGFICWLLFLHHCCCRRIAAAIYLLRRCCSPPLLLHQAPVSCSTPPPSPATALHTPDHHHHPFWQLDFHCPCPSGSRLQAQALPTTTTRTKQQVNWGPAPAAQATPDKPKQQPDNQVRLAFSAQAPAVSQTTTGQTTGQAPAWVRRGVRVRSSGSGQTGSGSKPSTSSLVIRPCPGSSSTPDPSPTGSDFPITVISEPRPGRQTGAGCQAPAGRQTSGIQVPAVRSGRQAPSSSSSGQTCQSDQYQSVQPACQLSTALPPGPRPTRATGAQATRPQAQALAAGRSGSAKQAPGQLSGPSSIAAALRFASIICYHKLLLLFANFIYLFYYLFYYFYLSRAAPTAGCSIFAAAVAIPAGFTQRRLPAGARCPGSYFHIFRYFVSPGSPGTNRTVHPRPSGTAPPRATAQPGHHHPPAAHRPSPARPRLPPDRARGFRRWRCQAIFFFFFFIYFWESLSAQLLPHSTGCSPLSFCSFPGHSAARLHWPRLSCCYLLIYPSFYRPPICPFQPPPPGCCIAILCRTAHAGNYSRQSRQARNRQAQASTPPSTISTQ